MESALAWIGQIASWIGQWIPRWVILDPTIGAVKYVHGSRPVVLLAGIHFWWPATTTVQTYPVARQADDLRSQTIVTTDDKTVVIGGMVVYRVIDLSKLLPTTYRPEQAIKDIVLTVIHEVCGRMSWLELKTESRKGTLDTKLRNGARKQLEDYGVDVIKVQLTDLAPARVYKVMQSTSQDEI